MDFRRLPLKLEQSHGSCEIGIPAQHAVYHLTLVTYVLCPMYLFWRKVKWSCLWSSYAFSWHHCLCFLGMIGGRSWILTVLRDICNYTKRFCIKKKFPKPFHSGGRIVSVPDHSRIVMVRSVFLSSPINLFSIEALLWFAKAQNHPVSSLWHFLNYKWTWTSCWDIKIKLVANSKNWSS